MQNVVGGFKLRRVDGSGCHSVLGSRQIQLGENGSERQPELPRFWQIITQNCILTAGGLGFPPIKVKKRLVLRLNKTSPTT
jgi:hypothetical protein